MLDTLQQIQPTCWLGVDWLANWSNYLFYITLGLLSSLFYFYQKKQVWNVGEPNNWSNMWLKYKNIIITHGILYFMIIFIWITAGGSSLFLPITIPLKLILSLIGADATGAIDVFNKSIEVVMPIRQLTWFTIFWGFCMTSLIKNWIPEFWKWFWNRFFSPKG